MDRVLDICQILQDKAMRNRFTLSGGNESIVCNAGVFGI